MSRFLSNRWVHFFLLSAMVLTASLYSFSDARWRQELQFLVFDGFNRLHPRERSEEIIIVDIDDESLKALGQWPWPRTVVAKMVDNLTNMGARVIAFDGVLAEPDRSSPHYLLQSLPDNGGYTFLRENIEMMEDHDQILARSLENSRIFVSGFTFSTYTGSVQAPYISRPILISGKNKDIFLKHTQSFKNAATFLPILEQASAGNGSFMATPDADGVLRRAGLVFSDGKHLYPSLSLEALRVASGNKASLKIGGNPNRTSNKIDTNYRLLIGDDYKIPIEHSAEFLVYYRPFDSKNGDYISAHKVINTDYFEDSAPIIRDKIVLVGASAEGLKDLRFTAIESFQPGVEIHANVIEQILQNKFLLRPHITFFAEANFILAVGILVVMLAPFIHVLFLALLSFALIGMGFVGANFAYASHGILLDPLYPSLCIFLVFVISILLTYLRTESERKQIRDAFGFYISPEYMEDLAAHPEKLKLGGELRDLSVMFTDIRNFTTISEDMEPAELIQLMNDFLTPMSDLVMQNKGTIDKYMGDAMMAFWNAPLDVENHAYLACKTALGMQEALEPINKLIESRAEERGKDAVLLRAGIGINTGPCAVGNMGSKQRFAYSTLGDTVNLSSRLEAQTKNYGAAILIGETTWRDVRSLACVEADLLQVKGKTKPERIFILLGDEALQNNESFQEFQLLHAQMIDLYRCGEFQKAKDTLERAQNIQNFELDALYDIYESRINDMIETPPAKGWNGVYVAKTK